MNVIICKWVKFFGALFIMLGLRFLYIFILNFVFRISEYARTYVGWKIESILSAMQKMIIHMFGDDRIDIPF